MPSAPAKRRHGVHRNLQDDERGVILSTVEVQVLLEAKDGGVRNVDSIQEGEEVEQGENGNDPEVDLVHDLALIDVGEADFVRDALNRRRGRRLELGLLFQDGGIAL